MRKALLAISILVATGTATAEYTAKIPLEQAQGGSLPNGSITFTNQEPTTPTDLTAPILDCVNNPEENPTECQERLYAWQAFAYSKMPPLNNTWNTLSWYFRNLTTIPTEPYPLTSVQYLSLSNNQLTNVDGLSNLTSVNVLELNNNQLTNVDGLRNLTRVNSFYLNNNQLTNINGLSNLTSVYFLYLDNNQLTNINGLANLEIMGNIRIDATYAGPKLAATTRFCSVWPDRFLEGFAQKTQLCESP